MSETEPTNDPIFCHDSEGIQHNGFIRMGCRTTYSRSRQYSSLRYGGVDEVLVGPSGPRVRAALRWRDHACSWVIPRDPFRYGISGHQSLRMYIVLDGHFSWTFQILFSSFEVPLPKTLLSNFQIRWQLTAHGIRHFDQLLLNPRGQIQDASGGMLNKW